MVVTNKERVETNAGTRTVNSSKPALLTGIAAFDSETGGMPLGRLVLVAGGESTGKTIFGLEFLYHGLSNEERVTLITSETPETWLARAEAFGRPLNDAVQNGNLHILYQKSQVPHTITNEEQLRHMLEMLEGEILPWEPKRLVIDSAVPFIELLHPSFRRAAIEQIVHRLTNMGLTTVMITRMPASSETMTLRKQMEMLSGCSLHLDKQTTPEGEEKRRMVCRKHDNIDPPYPVFDFSIEHSQGIVTEGSSAVPLQAPSEQVKMPQKAQKKTGLFASAMGKAGPSEANSSPESRPEAAVVQTPKKQGVSFSSAVSPKEAPTAGENSNSD